jgi:hypothetical protein
VLKEAVLRSDCGTTIGSMFGRADAAGGQLLERLLLVLHAYGTNTAIRAVAAGEHGHREEELYYVRRRYLNPELVRALAIDIANATFGARRQSIWGAGSTTVASDSTHFGAFDANIFTEYYSRYGAGRMDRGPIIPVLTVALKPVDVLHGGHPVNTLEPAHPNSWALRSVRRCGIGTGEIDAVIAARGVMRHDGHGRDGDLTELDAVAWQEQGRTIESRRDQCAVTSALPRRRGDDKGAGAGARRAG